MQPVWAWNEFNHLDPNRHPYLFPDWTHTNAVLYSPDDGNILVSMRHQNWVVKVDYQDGKGSGAIIWRLGEGGNFTLKNGVDPTDWQYAQHMPRFFSPNTTGVFSLGVMDNGDDRIFAGGMSLAALPGTPPCLYTTIPVFQIDENAKTATLIFHQILPANLYSNFGGNVDPLANGNMEYDLCGVGQGASSYIYEVTPPEHAANRVDDESLRDQRLPRNSHAELVSGSAMVGGGICAVICHTKIVPHLRRSHGGPGQAGSTSIRNPSPSGLGSRLADGPPDLGPLRHRARTFARIVSRGQRRSGRENEIRSIRDCRC